MWTRKARTALSAPCQVQVSDLLALRLQGQENRLFVLLQSCSRRKDERCSYVRAGESCVRRHVMMFHLFVWAWPSAGVMGFDMFLSGACWL